MKYVFHTTKFEPTDRPGVYHCVTLERFGKTVEQAYALAEASIPEGHRVWCWWEDPAGACTMCGGPFSAPTGHWESEKRHWCGRCTKEMMRMLKSFLPRRWGGVRFYDHAFFPQGDTSAADRAADGQDPR
jgi:hypothetical protein